MKIPRVHVLGGRCEGSELLSSIFCHVRGLCVKKTMANHQRIKSKEVYRLRQWRSTWSKGMGSNPLNYWLPHFCWVTSLDINRLCDQIRSNKKHLSGEHFVWRFNLILKCGKLIIFPGRALFMPWAVLWLGVRHCLTSARRSLVTVTDASTCSDAHSVAFPQVYVWVFKYGHV